MKILSPLVIDSIISDFQAAFKYAQAEDKWDDILSEAEDLIEILSQRAVELTPEQLNSLIVLSNEIESVITNKRTAVFSACLRFISNPRIDEGG